MNQDVTLHVVFQPFYNLLTESLQGFEALARLEHVRSGETEFPQHYLESHDAETARRMDLKVLDRALRQLADWQADESRSDLIMAVNMSPVLIGQADVVFDVSAALGEYGLSGDRVLLDTTTEAFRGFDLGGDELPEHIVRMRDRGVSLCLDAFTVDDIDLLPHAAKIPVDIIKLDPRLVREDSEGFQRAVEAIQEAGLPVLAAGIETAEQFDLVREAGCEWAQGFYLGRPVPAAEARDFPRELTLG